MRIPGRIALAALAASSVVWAAVQRQYDALLRMSFQTIDYSPRGPVENIVRETGIVLPPDAPARPVGGPAADLFPLVKDLLLANGTETLTVRKNWLVYGSERGLSLAQSIRGIPMVNDTVSLGYNARTRLSSTQAEEAVHIKKG